MISQITDEIYFAVVGLVPQLGVRKSRPTKKALEALVASDSSKFFVARFPDERSPAVGMLTLALYRVPTGIRSIVEDVVVDTAFRNKGIAKALLLSAMEIAREAGANGVALTSNPQRVEANQLYLRMGFKKRETNAYFYELK